MLVGLVILQDCESIGNKYSCQDNSDIASPRESSGNRIGIHTLPEVIYSINDDKFSDYQSGVPLGILFPM